MTNNTRSNLWKAPAKINLFLHITGRREDGYHNLQTVFQFLNHYDQIHFSPRDDGAIIYRYHEKGLQFENDLIARAVQVMQKKAEQLGILCCGLDITLDKILPMGGGLGGGSSDAATTLVALNEIWQLKQSRGQLAELGLQLGADVPVFVHGEAVWAEGVGEKFTPIVIEEPWYVVLIPPVHVSTPELFKHPELERDMPKMVVDDYHPNCGKNVFEKIACQSYLEIDKALQWLRQYAPARMTGSGACVFASFVSEHEANKVVENLPEGMQGFVAKGLNESPLYEK